MTLTVAEVLTLAADILTPEGAWRRGGYTDGHATCMAGAINKAEGISLYSDSSAAARFVQNAMKPLTVAGWNDAPERTQPEVVAKLRELAALSLSPPADQVRG